MNKIITYKFSDTATDIPPESPPINMDEAKKWLEDKYKTRYSFGMDNLKSNGVYKLMGWVFDYRPLLKKYLYKQYGDWREIYAPSKTLLRTATYGTITKIIEI